MVAAEAAACGTLPVSAAHSGLAEVSGALAAHVPGRSAPLLSFELGPGAVEAIAARLWAGCNATRGSGSARARALVATVRERWSWESVAESVIAAARGELGRLPEP